MRILLISQYYQPEPNFITADLAEYLAHLGHEVTVLTAHPNYPCGKFYDTVKHIRPTKTREKNVTICFTRVEYSFSSISPEHTPGQRPICRLKHGRPWSGLHLLSRYGNILRIIFKASRNCPPFGNGPKEHIILGTAWRDLLRYIVRDDFLNNDKDDWRSS